VICSKPATGLLLVAALVGCGAPKPAECPCPATPAAEAAAAEVPPSPELEALARERVAKALEVVKMRQAMYDRGGLPLAEFLRSYRDVALAVRDAKLAKKERIVRLRAYAETAVKLRDLMRERKQSGAVTEADVAVTELAEVEARYWLQEATEGR
jgi:hypothetical protein